MELLIYDLGYGCIILHPYNIIRHSLPHLWHVLPPKFTHPLCHERIQVERMEHVVSLYLRLEEDSCSEGAQKHCVGAGCVTICLNQCSHCCDMLHLID